MAKRGRGRPSNAEYAAWQLQAEQAQEQFKALMWEKAGYTPFPLQLEAHNDPNRVKLVAGGIRAGKSYSAAMELLSRCAVPNGLYWIVGPDYAQAAAEFDYVYEVLEREGMITGQPSIPSKGPRKLKTIWGAAIETKTSDDVRKLASFAPDGIIMAEAAQQPHDVFMKMLERALQKRAWIWMCGTFESSLGWYADLFEEWQSPDARGRSFSIPTWSNLASFPGGRSDPGIVDLEESMSPELFMERCAAVPCAPAGLVHKAFSTKTHVRKLERVEGIPVELAIDPGYSGAYAVLFCQVLKRQSRVHVLGEVYARGLIAHEVLPLVRAHPLFKYCREGVIDRAGTQHHANYSQIEIWRDLLPEISLRWHYVTVEQGIEAINLRLKEDPVTREPRLLFDESLHVARDADGLAQGILGELLSRRYRPYNEGSSEPRSPIKANDHACNALGYLLYDHFGPVLVRAPLPKAKRRRYWR